MKKTPTPTGPLTSEQLRADLTTLLQSPQYQPLDRIGISKKFGLPLESRQFLRKTLQTMEAEGLVSYGARGLYRWRQPEASPRGSQRGVRGIVHLGRQGQGKFLADFKSPGDAAAATALGLTRTSQVSISEGALGTAWHGDVVLAEISTEQPEAWWKHVAEKRKLLESMRSSGQPAFIARVTKILERQPQTIVGTLNGSAKGYWITPDDPACGTKVLVVAGPGQAALGEKVAVEITEWPKPGRLHAQARLLRSLGAANAPGQDMLSIIYQFRLPQEFPAAVTAEAEAVPPVVPAAALKDREDWRRVEVITIDPFDAKDFDDAIAVKPLPNGGWELAVHIADVSHYVTPGSALDQEARVRGNSVYLADRVIPMLPERLSNGVCSLRPNEDRLTRCAVLTYDAKGVRTGARFCKAVICSRRRYSYEEAFEVMKPFLKKPAHAWDNPATPLPARAWTLGALLRKNRFAQGSLDLDFPEVKVVLDANGVPTELRRVNHDESHQMIEEFMLEANEAVAQQLRRAQRPALYRIHDDPDAERLQDLREFLLTNGIRVGDLTQRRELQKALALMEGRQEAPVLKLAVLKSMKRAAYHVDCTGHYGLAKENYLHFTSPIRRYADLIVHRVQGQLLFGAKEKSGDYAKLQELAEHLGHTERAAAEAELQSRKVKELAYFAKIIASPRPPVFQAMVSSVRRIGLFIEVTEIFTKGIVRGDLLEKAGFHFDAPTERYVRRSPAASFKLGDTVPVIPVYVETDRGSVAFRLADGPPPKPKKRH